MSPPDPSYLVWSNGSNHRADREQWYRTTSGRRTNEEESPSREVEVVVERILGHAAEWSNEKSRGHRDGHQTRRPDRRTPAWWMSTSCPLLTRL